MNYTGFGTDPNLIYSFRGAPTQAERVTVGSSFMDAYKLNQLKSSLAYRQTDEAGRQRMEKLMGMGLPVNTDINRVQRAGYDPSTQRPIYSAPRPQPFGTFGSIGLQEELPIPTSQQPATTQTPSLTQTTQLRETQLGQSGEPLAFTGFGQMARDQGQREKEQKASEFLTPVGRGITGIQATVGVPRFPFAGAESSFKPARETSTFGGLPMFPSSRFGGPQPAQTMGPVDTQPRRSWMY